jgi:preprotein translocase subunit SecA
VEAYNFDIRKRLIEYDDVMNKQREVIYGRRDEVIGSEDLDPVVEAMLDDHIETTVDEYIDPSELPENWPLQDFIAQLESVLLFSFGVPDVPIEEMSVEELKNFARKKGREAVTVRNEFLSRELGGVEYVREFQKFVMLQTIDEKWMDHLHELDSLKEGIHYRAYAQKNPLIEYKREAFDLFSNLNERIDRDALFAMFHARIAAERRGAADLTRSQAVHRQTGSYAMASQGKAPEAPARPGAQMGATAATSQVLQAKESATPVVRSEEKVGRNDPCPCGSGKKYKKCHGATG